MPVLEYRSIAHAVAGKGRYGYYKSLEYTTDRGDEALLKTVTGEQFWPLRLVVQVHIFNHEDLDKFTKGVLDLYEQLRGERGENELRSPSSIVPFKR